MSEARSIDVWNRAQALAYLADPTASDPDGTLARFRAFHAQCEAAGLTRHEMEAAESVLKLRERIEAGDGGATLDAVAHCADARLVMPDWLAEEFLRRHRAVGAGFARDWGDERAFGRAYPKGTNIAGIRARVNDAPEAYWIAARMLEQEPSRAIDGGLYEEVGRRIGVGKTRAFELVKMYLSDQAGFVAPLEELRVRIAAGRTLLAAHREWCDERFLREHKIAPPGK